MLLYITKILLGIIWLCEAVRNRRVFTVTTVHNENVFEITTAKDGIVIAIGGPEVNILETIAQALKAEIQLVIPDDQGWGNEDSNGNFSGMIGMLQRQADFAVNELAVTEDRFEVVDFSTPYLTSPVTFFTRAPSLENKLFVYTYPFEFEVWICLILTFFTFASVLRLHFSVSKSTRKFTFLDINFHLYGFLVNQGCGRKKFKENSVRLLLGVWMLSGAILFMCYVAVLLSLILMPVKAPALKTIQDLSTAVTEGTYSCGILTKTAYEDIFLKSTSGTLGLLGKHIKKYHNLFPPDRKLVMKTIQDRNFAFIGARQYTQLYLAAHEPEKYYISDDFFMIAYAAVAMRKGLPERSEIDKVIHYINQAGLYDKWVEDTLFKIKQKSHHQEETKKKSALALEDVKGIFLIIILGYLLSALVFVIEYISTRHQTKRIRKNAIKKFYHKSKPVCG